MAAAGKKETAYLVAAEKLISFDGCGKEKSATCDGCGKKKALRGWRLWQTISHDVCGTKETNAHLVVVAKCISFGGRGKQENNQSFWWL